MKQLKELSTPAKKLNYHTSQIHTFLNTTEDFLCIYLSIVELDKIFEGFEQTKTPAFSVEKSGGTLVAMNVALV
jgi:hypothetical protein